MLQNHVFGSFSLNNSEKHRFSSEDIFLGTLDTYTKKNEPTLGSSGGVHGKVCWFIAYNRYKDRKTQTNQDRKIQAYKERKIQIIQFLKHS